MKTWRVISLTLWGIILTTLLVVSGAYLLLAHTVLDQTRTTNALKQTAFYKTVREDAFLPAVRDQLAKDDAGGTILPPQDTLTEVERVFTVDKVQRMSDEILGATYRWLDKKTPELEFSVPIASEKQAIVDGLSARIRQNVAALPTCTRAADIPDRLGDATCLPPFSSRDEVSESAITEMNTHLRDTGDALTPEVLGMTRDNFGSGMNLPDFVSYAWALHLAALPLAALIILYLLLKRRGAGLIAVGASVFIVGIIAFALYGALSSPELIRTNDALANEMIRATKLMVDPILVWAGSIGVIVGIGKIVSGILWLRARRDLAPAFK